ncbi:hypothetical protein N9N28_05450 [Rubripirellula amarantea]|nr:hypothetical protein [Rubripirellula amarantea]
MSPNVQKLLPPSLVIGAAIYFGWPPSGSTVVNEGIARATSVRWRADDLEPPAIPSITVDPFASVLVVTAEKEVEEETGKLIPATRPAGPPERELRAGLSLTGIANIAGQQWAILNNRPRLPGDVLKTNDNNRHECEIVSVERDHVLVRCEETIAKIHVGNQQSITTTNDPKPLDLDPPTDSSSSVNQFPNVIPPPPTNMGSHNPLHR